MLTRIQRLVQDLLSPTVGMRLPSSGSVYREPPPASDIERELNRTRWLDLSQCSYNHDFKKTALFPFMIKMDSLGHLGPVIIDAGSGHLTVAPFSHFEPAYQEPRIYMPSREKKIVRIDWSLENTEKRTDNIFEIAADLENLSPKNHQEALRLLRLLRFLGVKPGSLPEVADTVLLSDILNYVDARKVILSLSRLLKPGSGRMVIINQNHMGLPEAWSSKRPENNTQILGIIKEAGLTLEHASLLHPASHFSYPNLILDEIKYVRQRIILVARKNADS